MSVQEQVKDARFAAYRLAVLPESTRNAVLTHMARLLTEEQAQILDANRRDTEQAEKEGLSPPLYKRLVLNERKLSVMASSLKSVAGLTDPIGACELRRELDEGLELTRVRVPIGVIGVIFESRPDALVQIASLAVKSGNSVILKGGREARETNRVLGELFVRSIREVDGAGDAVAGAVQLVETREDMSAVLELDSDIDLIIPRGSNELVKTIQKNTRIPVLGHADGICHMFINHDASEPMAVTLVKDAKTQYPAVCNAIETLLVHKDAAGMLPAIVAAMPEVEFRGCERTRKIIKAAPADDHDWAAEYNDLVLAVRIVDSFDQAVEHINRYGSHHTDAIVTEEQEAARRFEAEVDSSSVLVNASTRFADGFRYGLGAEVGISTGKIHARGPVGLEGLTTTQYRVRGNGHIVADYAEGRRAFTHRELT